MRRLATILAVAALVAACSSPAPSENTASPAITQARDGLFQLTLGSNHATYRPAEPIEISAQILYLVPKAITIYHSAFPVGWGIRQLDGPAVMEGVMADPCVSTQIEAGRPLLVPFQKGGIVNEIGPFDRAWYADPAIRLPAGRWRFTAYMAVSLDECGSEQHRLEASVDLAVVP